VSTFRSPAVIRPNNKPLSLVMTSSLILLSVVMEMAALIWRWKLAAYPLFALSIGPLFGAAILWFYWNGYSWSRYFVLLMSLFGVCDALYRLTGFRGLLFVGAVAQGGVYLNVSRLCVGIYFVAWLLTPQASRYFNADARAERKSHAAHLKLARTT